MNKLGHVSTEGGPLLLIDLAGVGEWSGVEGDDYGRACKLLDELENGGEISIGRQRGLLWEMPTGTAEIWRQSPDIHLLSRPWLDPKSNRSEDAQARRLAQLPRSKSLLLGRLGIQSGWLAILWAPENGYDILKVAPADGLALHLSVGNSAAIIRLPAGEYTCFQDEVEDNGPSSRRCWILPVPVK